MCVLPLNEGPVEGNGGDVAPPTRRRRLFVEHHNNNNNIVCTYDVYYRGYANNDALTTSSAIFIMV